mgnify:CR=1 FL=1
MNISLTPKHLFQNCFSGSYLISKTTVVRHLSFFFCLHPTIFVHKIPCESNTESDHLQLLENLLAQYSWIIGQMIIKISTVFNRLHCHFLPCIIYNNKIRVFFLSWCSEIKQCFISATFNFYHYTSGTFNKFTNLNI